MSFLLGDKAMTKEEVQARLHELYEEQTNIAIAIEEMENTLSQLEAEEEELQEVKQWYVFHPNACF